MKKRFFLLIGVALLYSCAGTERNCDDFMEGSFSFTTLVDGKEMTTTFARSQNLEIDEFNGKIDSSSVRWINDCEYVLKNLNPKNRAAEKPIHIKILTTTNNSYTFEYGIVGEAKKQRGTAIRIE